MWLDLIVGGSPKKIAGKSTTSCTATRGVTVLDLLHVRDRTLEKPYGYEKLLLAAS